MAENTVTLKITGLKELEDALESRPREAARKIMRSALQPAAQIWVDDMKARVRRGPHHGRGKGAAKIFNWIAEHIGMRTRVTSELAGTVDVGPEKAGFWALWLELTGRKAGVSRRGRHYPAMGKFPFIRPAFEARKKDVLEKFIEGVKQELRDTGLPLK